MAHGLIKATLVPEIVKLLQHKYSLAEDQALDLFYTSTVAENLSDDETGLYGQSALYIFSLLAEKRSAGN